MEYFNIIIGAVVIVSLICLFLIRRLNQWIDKNETGAKYYTRFTMMLSVISLGSILLMLIGVLMNAYIMEDTKKAMQAQAEGIAPVNPKIDVELIDEDYNHFFSVHSLVGVLFSTEKNTSYVGEGKISMFARNNGQGNAGDVHFYLMNSNKTFHSKSVAKSINPFDYAYIEFNVWNKECQKATREATGKEDFKKAYDICKEVKSKFPFGLMDWFLLVDCKPCKEQKKCYSFKICVYNETQEEKWCKLQWDKKFDKLEPMECPEEWGY